MPGQTDNQVQFAADCFDVATQGRQNHVGVFLDLGHGQRLDIQRGGGGGTHDPPPLNLDIIDGYHATSVSANCPVTAAKAWMPGTSQREDTLRAFCPGITNSQDEFIISTRICC